MDLVDPNASDLAKERENNMSSLVVGFPVRMLKRAMSAQGETTPVSKVSGGKRPKKFGPDEKAQRNLVIISMDSLE